MVYCSGLWLTTAMYIFTISFYKAFMPTTDIIWRWKAPSVLADILAYNVPQHTVVIDVAPELPGDTLVQGVVTDIMELIVVEPAVVVESIESIDQGVVTEAIEPVLVVESLAVLMVPEASLVPAATMPLDSPPNEATIRARPTRSAPIVTQAQSNLITMTAFVQLAVIMMVASVVTVLGRPSRSSKHLSIPILAPTCHPSPSPIGRSASFFALFPAAGVFIAQYLSDKPSLIVNILRSLSVGLIEYYGVMAFDAIISGMSNIFGRGQASQGSGIGRGEVTAVDFLRADHAELDNTSLLVLNLEAINNTASPLSGNLVPSLDLFGRPAEVDMSFDMPQAQDTSVCRELVSAQSIVSLYAGVSEENSVSIMMIEEMAKVYDVLNSIESAILSVASMDDLQAMESTTPLPSGDDLAHTTDIERLDRSACDELADETSSSETVSSVSSLWSVTDLRSAPPEWHSALSSPQVFESTGEFGHFDPSWSSEAKASLFSDETFAYRGLPPVDYTEISGSGYVSHEDGVLFMARSSCIRPSNSVLRFSSSRSSFDDLEVEDSFEMSSAIPIHKGVPSPSRIPVPSKRRKTSVDLVQVTRSPRTVRQSPSRIPIRSVRVQRSGVDGVSSIPSMQPIQRKPLGPPRFLAFAPKMCAQEESGSPARRVRRCHGCSQYSPRRAD
ncbi:uncharacterized protein EV420DRAFT_1126091 [Desarmillaria tabescens]|uniref:Transmembrane protein n=1 Tax=Armillaria tabescens TaxID=1929756 RepID=A0AA39MP58_ARMTA|nr:uncharacterized protein EV420DRAFT_1126091 [Desarmillaria tabescens]KAK0440914.1 hypothetical protein EV420DRAFT_1126091 [Desarmillaria tabescens]